MIEGLAAIFSGIGTPGAPIGLYLMAAGLLGLPAAGIIYLIREGIFPWRVAGGVGIAGGLWFFLARASDALGIAQMLSWIFRG